MRESRIALSSEPLPDSVLQNFVRVLAPYRRRNSQVLQLSYYLVASSVLAKAPLLRETPVELEAEAYTNNMMHDSLVLASRLAKSAEGAKTIRSGSFTRYFHYLVCITSLNGQLKVRAFSLRRYFVLQRLLTTDLRRRLSRPFWRTRGSLGIRHFSLE